MFKENLELLLENIVHTLRSRIFWAAVLMFCLFSILIGRLYVLQIKDGASYYESYTEKTTRTIRTPAVRGNIYDRNGVLLAGNEIVYNLTIKDLSVYTKANGQYNEMLLRLIRLLDRYGVTVDQTCPVFINEHGEFEFSGSETVIRRFILDVYGSSYIEAREKEGIDVYAYDTQTVMDRLMNAYNFTSRWSGREDCTKQEALDICNIRYAMSATSYTRYIATTIAVDVSEELRNAILENQAELQGVEVDKSEKRIYPDSVYFASLIGYTGRVSAEELAELREQDSTYAATDYVGKSGLEKVYETYLAGTKGEQVCYVNNVGLILNTISETDSQTGANLYTTLDKDLTVATYNLIEQRLAAILTEKLVNEDFTADASLLAEEIVIPVKDAFSQLINNNILDESAFHDEDATENEQAIAQIYDSYKALVLSHLRDELSGENPTIRSEAGDELGQYISFVLNLLTSQTRNILVSSSIDRTSDLFASWDDGTISLQEYLRGCVDRGWIDSTKLSTGERYSDADTVYARLVDRILELLDEDTSFMKLLYEIMINNEVLPGTRICMALIDQGVVDDNGDYERLENGDSETAFAFIREKIENIEITPAQLALDPCSGSAVVVDESTGELLCLVSYPGYDLNYFSGSVDPTYWKQLTEDLSMPLYNRATQARTAPGSTYKMVTATAGLMEGVVTPNELIDCEGTFDLLDHPMCWIAREYPGSSHGELNAIGGLANSCNIYFYTLGYRLSLNEEGEYDASLGIEKLNEYARLYGFGEPTGIEVSENISTLTTEYPVTSAIGQGTNNYTCLSLARYAEVVASKGTLYNFLLLDRVEDADGNLILDAGPTVERQLDLPDDVWDILHEGMYSAVHGDGSQAQVFAECEVEVAGKSGSAQENKLRANHGMFVSFAPYDNPQIATAVSIPNGYNASSASLITREIHRYYFGYITLEDILNNNYSTLSGSTMNND